MGESLLHSASSFLAHTCRYHDRGGVTTPLVHAPDVFAQERDHYSQFVAEAFDSYVSRKEKDGVHGNNPEMQAASELFNRPIEVYVPEKGSEQQALLPYRELVATPLTVGPLHRFRPSLSAGAGGTFQSVVSNRNWPARP